LAKPGPRPEIVIPEYVRPAPPSDEAYGTEDFTVLEAANTSTASVVSRADVTAFGRVQSHWRPTRRWVFDRGKNAAVWVRIKDDGEYVFGADFRQARPMNGSTLAERIDRLIAEDVKVLRDFRNG
jgi:hypothetical protein